MIRPFGSLLRLVRRRPRSALVALAVLLFLGLTAVVGVHHLLALHHFRAAQRASERHKLREARRHLEKCLRAWPSRAEVHLLTARVARRAGDLDDADRHLHECERLDNGRSEALKLEAILLQTQAGDFSPQMERHLLAQAGQNDDEAPLILEALAHGYAETLRLPAALQCLNRVVEQQPDNGVALALRGWVKERQSKYDAVNDYRLALELDPNDEQTRLRLAESLFTFGRPEQAALEFTTLARSGVFSDEVRLGLARCHAQRGELAAAEEELDALLADAPGHVGALCERGRLALEADQGALAEGCLRRALAQEPTDRDANHLLFQALRQQGKEDAAREQQEQTRRVLADLKRIGEIYNVDMPNRPRDPALHCELGVLYLRYGKDKLGVHWLRSALRENPNYEPARRALDKYNQRLE
jgi:predicted Zn-dependent protease